jgi:hypothetical protein
LRSWTTQDTFVLFECLELISDLIEGGQNQDIIKKLANQNILEVLDGIKSMDENVKNK